MVRSTYLAFTIILSTGLLNAQQCPDLYKHCDKWKSQVKRPPSEPIWNRWQEAKANLAKEVRHMLLNSPDSWGPRVMYESCVNVTELENRGLKQMRSLLKQWPLINNGSQDEPQKFSWLKTLLLLHKLGASPLLNIHVSPNIFHPAHYVLYVEPGSRFLPDGEQNHFKDYGQWIFSVAKIFSASTTGLGKQVLEILRLEKQLEALSEDHNDGYTATDLSSISSTFPAPFDKYFPLLVHDKNLTFDSPILVKSMKYLQGLFELLEVTPSVTISNYLGWCLFREVSRDSVQQFRHLSFLMDEAILGVTEDVPRDIECVRFVMDTMGYSVAGKVNIHEDVIHSVKMIFAGVKTEFMLLLNGTEWLGDHTKFQAIRKIENVRIEVALPKWVQNEKVVNEYYSDLPLGCNHLSNVLNWKLWKRNKEFSLLGSFVEDLEWPLSPFDVNAFYNVLQNVIIIPIAILQLPFFSSKRSIAQNYGALGSLIGHELSHALDTSGRHFSPDGEMKAWWTPKEIRMYQKKVQCFVEQYQQFGVDGEETLGENIADSVGLFLAYEALWNKSANLSYHDEQEFFYSFAMQWCEVSSESVERLSDAHAPVSYRVVGATSNLPSFQQAYNCIQTREFCKIW